MYAFEAIQHAVRIHAGQDALAHLPRVVERCGASRAFVICGHSVATRTDLVARLHDLLGDRLAGVFSGIQKDAPVGCVQDAAAAAKAAGADLLLAVGAGSVIKAVRVVSILMSEAAPLEALCTQYPDGKRAVSPRLLAPKVPIVNILTAPTSAQHRAGSALKHEQGGPRLEFFDPKTRPVAIFWDADALLTAPVSLARSTGFSVYWRALMNMGALAAANPLVEGSRRQAFALARRALPRMTDVADYQSRIDLCAAAMLQNRDEDDGGRPFDAHWIARAVYALAAPLFNNVEHVDQAHAYAVLTGAAIRQLGDRCPEVTHAIGTAIGADAPAPDGVAAAVEREIRGLGMPTRLRELGIEADALAHLPTLAQQNFNADRNRDFIEESARLSAMLQSAW